MFQKAVPVWVPCDREEDKLNRQLIFRETLSDLRGVSISIAAADFYRLTVNGHFVGFGPARTTKGYARVDVHDLSAYDAPEGEENEIVIEVAGYHCGSLSTARQNSFFAAELTENGTLLKYTCRDFPCYENCKRVRKVERFSAQRHFNEIYDERTGDRFADAHRVKTEAIAENIRFLPRRVPMPAYHEVTLDGFASRGVYTEIDSAKVEKLNAYSFVEEGWGSFSPDEIVDKPYRYVKCTKTEKLAGAGGFPVTVKAGEWFLLDCEKISVGFLRWSGVAHEETDVILAYTELCDNDKFAFTNINMQSVIEYHLPAGKEYDTQSFEPYSFKQLAFFVKSGSLTIHSVGYRTFERDMSTAIKREFKDPLMNDIYAAALRTFAHNAVDLYTDCPSRERAGWLCDSFFTGRAEYFLFGNTAVEDAFLENYVLFEDDGTFPQGVLPMCYPSDPHQNGKFIPQWDMWYVLEVCEYLTVRNPEKDRECFRASVFGILDFLSRYENKLGLLESLPSWNFIEWSAANTWTTDINYPTNMLYAGVLEAVAGVYGRPEMKEKADRIRKTAIEMSFDGEVFIDNAKRLEDGTYENTKNVSEACQYYAILFGGVDLEAPKYEKLKAYVYNNFESFDAGDRVFCPKNAFIGLYLRMNVLLNIGNGKMLYDNIKTFCEGMCRTTGTLWEYREQKGSYDHGFASYLSLAIPLADGAKE